ncbi:MAG: LacI family DNA-binding transcriptional regulator [Verrucomicrobiota bacterium]
MFGVDEGRTNPFPLYSKVTTPSVPALRVRPSLRTLAALAGVTSMTVSLALRNHPSIPVTTRARLKKLAAEQGYRPDPTVAKLMLHLRTRRLPRTQSSICALRMRPPPVTAQGYDYGQQAVDGVRRGAEALGFGFEEMFIDEPGLTPRRLQRILSSRGVEGVVLLPMVRPVRLGQLLDWPAFSVVAATSSVLTPRVHTVIPDQFSNTLKLCERLDGEGCERVGLATHADHDVRVKHRVAAALGWHRESRGREPIPTLRIDRGRLDAKALATWIEKYALQAVASDSEFDLDLLAAALPAGTRRRLRFLSTSVYPPLARYEGINEKPDEVGVVAVETLAAMIQRGERGLPKSARTVTITGEFWVPRGAKRGMAGRG